VKRNGLRISVAAVVCLCVAAACGGENGAKRAGASGKTRSAVSRTIRTDTCRIKFRGFSLSWRGTVHVVRGEVASYTIVYRTLASAGGDALRGRHHNNEELTYWNGTWKSRDDGFYERWLTRIPAAAHGVDGRDTPGDWVYLDGWFDLPGEDGICSLSVSLKTGKSEGNYAIDSGEPF
jgi:hypothetical protein